MHLAYKIVSETPGNNVDVFFVDQVNYDKFKSAQTFSYYVAYSRVNVVVADYPAASFRGGNTQYYLLVAAHEMGRSIVLSVDVTFRFQ